MPVTNVRTTRSAASAVGYNMLGRGAEWRENVLEGTSRAVWHMDHFGDEEVFVRYCEMSKARSDGVEALTYVVSWPDTEMDPDNQAHWTAAGMFGVAFAQRYAKGHPYDVSVHTDGEGRKVHAHIVIANRSLVDETLLTTKKEITLHRMVARKVDEMALEWGMGVIERQRAGSWQAMRAKHVESYERERAKLAPGKKPPGGGQMVRSQVAIAIGDVLAGIYEEGLFSSFDEWVERCREAGVEVEVKPDKAHDGVLGVTYHMKVAVETSNKKGDRESTRKAKASRIAADFTANGIEARIAELQRQAAVDAAERVRREQQEQLARRQEQLDEIQERIDAVERDREAARARHEVPDLAVEFERRWDDSEQVRVSQAEVVRAADAVRSVVESATAWGADATVCAGLADECEEIAHGEVPRRRRNERHVPIAAAMGDGLTGEARTVLDGLEHRGYRHALRDETAAQEALRKLRDREERAARAEAKADNARGFIRHTIAYGVLMYRWFQVGMARYDLMRELGADGGEPPAGDEFGGMRSIVADGIANMEHAQRFADLAGVDVSRHAGMDSTVEAVPETYSVDGELQRQPDSGGLE